MGLRSRLAIRKDPVTAEVADTYETGRMIKVDGSEAIRPEVATETYTLYGLPDDYTLTIALKGDQDNAKQAALYTARMRLRWQDRPDDCPPPFRNEDVYKIKLVHHYLQPSPKLKIGEDGFVLVGPNGKVIPETDESGAVIYLEPDSEYDVAFTTKENGPLFTRMYIEAAKIANNKTSARVGDQEIEDPIVTVGLGKSENGETPNSDLPLPASTPTASTQTVTSENTSPPPPAI